MLQFSARFLLLGLHYFTSTVAVFICIDCFWILDLMLKFPSVFRKIYMQMGRMCNITNCAYMFANCRPNWSFAVTSNKYNPVTLTCVDGMEVYFYKFIKWAILERDTVSPILCFFLLLIFSFIIIFFLFVKKINCFNVSVNFVLRILGISNHSWKIVSRAH